LSASIGSKEEGCRLVGGKATAGAVVGMLGVKAKNKRQKIRNISPLDLP